MAAKRAATVGAGAALAVGVVAAGWFALRPTPAPPFPLPEVASAPQTFGSTGVRSRFLPPNPAGLSLDVLPMLQPGMSRAEVEDVVGLPPSVGVDPIDLAGGRATYRTAYPIDLTPGGGGGRAPRPPAGVGPQGFVAFEFDATLPGHPLVNVHYPDPLY